MSDRLGQPGASASSSWRRWEPSAFQTRAKASDAGAADAAPKPPSPAEIASLIEQAKSEAIAAGRQQGLAEGRAEGEAAGYSAGLAAGKQAGYSEGYDLALAQARSEVTHEKECLQTLVGTCAEELAKVEESVGAAMIELALDVARQVVRRELAHRPDTICAVVSEILHAAPAEQPALKIWLNPADIELVRLYLQTDHGHAKWRLYPDASLTRGGCRAESIHGAIDATLQTRWQRVAAGLGKESLWIDTPLTLDLPQAVKKPRRAAPRRTTPPETPSA